MESEEEEEYGRMKVLVKRLVRETSKKEESEKNAENERDRGTEGETPNSIQETDALIGDEEQTGKK